MRPEVEQFVQQKNAEYAAVKNARDMEERIKVLDLAGMFRIEYAPEGAQWGNQADINAAFPLVGVAPDGRTRRYRKMYLDVTDEEYAAICNAIKLSEEQKATSANKNANRAGVSSLIAYDEGNGVATMLLVLAIITYLAFFIIGIVMGNQPTLLSYSSSREKFNFGTALLFWIIGLFSGTMLLGFSKIVEQLVKQTNLIKRVLRK